MAGWACLLAAVCPEWLWCFLALEARAGMQICWHSSDQVVVPVLFLLRSHFVQLFLSLSGVDTGFYLKKKKNECQSTWLRLFWEGALDLVP